MTDTCILAVSFRLPPAPQRWYSDKDLAKLWRVAPRTVAWYRWKARKLGYPPRPDQYLIRRLNACRRFALINDEYAGLLQSLFFFGSRRS